MPCRFVFITCTLLLISGARAAVVVDTVEGRVGDFGSREEIRQSLVSDIKSGTFDNRHWKFPVTEKADGKTSYTELSSRTFSALPTQLQNHIALFLAAGDENLRAYRVTVDSVKNDLHSEPVIGALNIDVKTLGRRVPAERLLSTFASRWAYKISPATSGVNCYFTTIASLFTNWLTPRHMQLDEFIKTINGHFTRIASPTQWGDVIYLFKNDHAFLYLGRDRKDPNRVLVFTKNGYRQSHFVFMAFADVVSLYGAREAAYFRRNIAVTEKESEVENDPTALTDMRAEIDPAARGDTLDAALEQYVRQHPPELSRPFSLAVKN